ncbi:uncharacterized protein LOC135948074 [Cloeon dipterum]|uniref:uncharacterized protein LOC135948074 n=1 Tax=Cloeon dipterum TaxID=197152 RepID=UPI003220A0CC
MLETKKPLLVLCIKIAVIVQCLVFAMGNLEMEYIDIYDIKSYQCPDGGLQLHPKNCHAVILCVESLETAEFVPTAAVQCPRGYSIDKSTLLCEPEADITPMCETARGNSSVTSLELQIEDEGVIMPRFDTCVARGAVCIDCYRIAYCFWQGLQPTLIKFCKNLYANKPACNKASDAALTGSCGATFTQANCPTTTSSTSTSTSTSTSSSTSTSTSTSTSSSTSTSTSTSTSSSTSTSTSTSTSSSTSTSTSTSTSSSTSTSTSTSTSSSTSTSTSTSTSSSTSTSTSTSTSSSTSTSTSTSTSSSTSTSTSTSTSSSTSTSTSTSTSSSTSTSTSTTTSPHPCPRRGAVCTGCGTIAHCFWPYTQPQMHRNCSSFYPGRPYCSVESTNTEHIAFCSADITKAPRCN